MLYLNKFMDPYKINPETIHMFNKVKNGEFHLVISQTTLMEIYHVLMLPIEKIKNNSLDNASQLMDEAQVIYKKIQSTMLQLPNTEFLKHEFDGINSSNMIDFVENVPGSSLIDFVGKKLPGSMDFIHIMIASNFKCTKFFTEDKGILNLNSYRQKGDMKIIRPYKP